MSSNFSKVSAEGNSSSPANALPVWESQVVFLLVSGILNLVLNGLVVSFFLLVKNLGTIAVYIVILLLSNIAIGVSAMQDFLNSLYGYWWTGSRACDLYQYLNWVAPAVTSHTQLLIAITRIWAITWPVSYRARHTVKLALILNMAVITYVHITGLPGFLLDAIYYRLPEAENGCRLNTAPLRAYVIFANIVLIDTPLVLVLAAAPVMWYQWRRRRGTGNLPRNPPLDHSKGKEYRPLQLIDCIYVENKAFFIRVKDRATVPNKNRQNRGAFTEGPPPNGNFN